MIQINCTNCRTQLSIDDAFAGGVCRCQHCGTIQTVPAHLKHSSGSPSDTIDHVTQGGRGNGAAKTLYQKKTVPTQRSGSGLDDLAGIVASSGLSGSGLNDRSTRKSPPKPGNQMMPILISAGAVIILLVGVIVWLAMRGGPAPSATAGPNQPNPEVQPNPSLPVGGPTTPQSPTPGPTPAPTSAKPNFFGVDIPTANTVVYLVDRGQGSSGYFDRMKQACLASLSTLGPERRFQVILWDNGTDPVAYPTSGPLLATADNIEACRKALDDVVAAHQSTLDHALPLALKGSPDVVLLVTAKLLDADFATQVLALRGSSPVRIDCFYLGQAQSDDKLKMIANSTGGQEHDLADSDIHF